MSLEVLSDASSDHIAPSPVPKLADTLQYTQSVHSASDWLVDGDRRIRIVAGTIRLRLISTARLRAWHSKPTIYARHMRVLRCLCRQRACDDRQYLTARNEGERVFPVFRRARVENRARVPSRAIVMNSSEKGGLAPLAVLCARAHMRSEMVRATRKHRPDVAQLQLFGEAKIDRRKLRDWDVLMNDPIHMERRKLVERGMKRCRVCQAIKPLTDFYSHSAAHKRCVGGVANVCKDCAAQAARDKELQRTYGLTQADYDTLFAAQGFSCAICGLAGKSLDTMARTHHRRGPVAGVLSVDHDHTTGGVRGLLCVSCNLGLGYFRDDPDVLKRAIEYVARYIQQN